jgi:hypothetical protein
LIFLGVLNGLAPALTLNGVALGVNTFQQQVQVLTIIKYNY